MTPFLRSTPALFLALGLPLLVIGMNGPKGQLIVPPAQSSIPMENQCVGDGLQVCRCYCRAEFRQCQNNQVSYSSVPLCKVPWSSGNCPALSYFQTQVTAAASCAMQNSQPCGGYIRPGDAPDTLNQAVAGQLLGCEIVALPSSSPSR